MTARKDTGLSDDGLDRLLDTLTPPPPSDLLRARLQNGIRARGETARRAAPHAEAEPRRPAFRGRIAAALVLVAGVGLAVWWPAPGTAPGDRAVTAAAAVAVSRLAFDPGPAGADAVAETGFSLTLVGDADATASGIGLVRANWSGVEAAQADAAAHDAGVGDESPQLDAIPLD